MNLGTKHRVRYVCRQEVVYIMISTFQKIEEKSGSEIERVSHDITKENPNAKNNAVIAKYS